MKRRDPLRASTIVLLITVFQASIPPGAAQEPAFMPPEETPPRAGWVESGSMRFLRTPDATQPKVFQTLLPAKRVHALLSTGDTLWIGTDGGVFAYIAANDSVFAVTLPAPGPIYTIAYDDAGSIWFGGAWGVSIRGAGGWRHYSSSTHPFLNRVRDLFHGDEKMWVGTFGHGAAAIADDSITVYTREDSLLDNRILTIVEETPHTVWFGTSSGLCMADTLHWESMRYGSRIPVGAVEDLLFDEEGNLFLAIARQGVTRYHLGRVRTYRPTDGLPSMEIHAFSLDPTGMVWAAGQSGVSTYDGAGWTPYRLPEFNLSGYHFRSIHHDLEGNCYLGTDEGTVLVLSRARVRVVTLPQPFHARTVSRMKRYNDAIWLLADQSIFLHGDSHVEYEPPSPWYGAAINDIAIDRHGRLWTASRFGVLHFNGRAWEVFDRRQGLPTEHFTTVDRDTRGHLWFGTHDAGVLEYTGSDWIHYTEAFGLPGMDIGELVTDGRGVPWIVTGSGLVARFSDSRWQESTPPGRGEAQAATADTLHRLDPGIRFLSRRMREGALPEKVCLGLDGDGNCLIGRRDGIYRWSGSAWMMVEPPQSPAWRELSTVLGTSGGELWVGTDGSGLFIRRRSGWVHFHSAHGLADECIQALVEDEAGQVWIGTRFGGIARFLPEADRRQ